VNKTINNNKVIIINGSAGTGKDSFVKLCQQISTKIMNVSTIDYPKQIARYFGWEGEKDEKSRRMLSGLKDLLTEYDDIPFKKIKQFIMACKNQKIFVHCREPHEIERLKKEYNAITLLITNPNVATISTNHADAEVYNYQYDWVISNDGTLEDLKDKAEIFLSEINKGD